MLMTLANIIRNVSFLVIPWHPSVGIEQRRHRFLCSYDADHLADHPRFSGVRRRPARSRGVLAPMVDAVQDAALSNAGSGIEVPGDA